MTARISKHSFTDSCPAVAVVEIKPVVSLSELAQRWRVEGLTNGDLFADRLDEWAQEKARELRELASTDDSCPCRLREIAESICPDAGDAPRNEDTGTSTGWRDAPPSQSGWYWCCWWDYMSHWESPRGPYVSLLRVDVTDGVAQVWDERGGYWEELSTCWKTCRELWMGPIAEPEPPAPPTATGDDTE